MNKQMITSILRYLTTRESVYHADVPLLMPLSSSMASPVEWNRRELEVALKATLPDELLKVWSVASEVRLFEDTTYGQWGLVLWSPEKIVSMQDNYILKRTGDILPGDIIVGEFLGDSDLLLIRGDESAIDFGCVHVVLPLEPRPLWPIVADSLQVFMQLFAASDGKKYWEER